MAAVVPAGGEHEGTGDSSPERRSADTTPVTDVPFGQDAASAQPPAPALTPPTPHHGRRSVWPFVTVGILGLASIGAAVYALAEKGSGAGDNNAALQSAVATTVHSKTADIAMSVTISL